MRYYHIMKKVSCGRYRGPMTGKKITYGIPYYRSNNRKRYFCDQVNSHRYDQVENRI